MSKFTREAIIHTFLGMLKEKDLEKITVTEIVDTCGINRKTFYYYFSDTYDLLEQAFGDRLKSYESEFEIPPSPEQFVLNLTEYMRVNHRAVMHIYNSNKDFLQLYVAQMSKRVFLKYVKSQLGSLPCSAEDQGLIAHVMSLTFTGLVMSWLRNGINTSPEEYIKLICGMMKNSVFFLRDNLAQYNREHQSE